jgi:hypothetical protein
VHTAPRPQRNTRNETHETRKDFTHIKNCCT